MFELSYREFIQTYHFREHKDHVWFCLQDAIGSVAANEIAGGRKLTAIECVKLSVRLLMSPSWNPTSSLTSTLQTIAEANEETPVFAVYSASNVEPPLVADQISAHLVAHSEFSFGDEPLIAVHVLEACRSPDDLRSNIWFSKEQAKVLARV